MILRRVAPLVLALLLDALCGEPPGWLHPVVWMGRGLAWLETAAPRGQAARLSYGFGVALGAPLVWGCLARFVENALPWPLQALVLKPAFAGRALLDASRGVEVALGADRLVDARHALRSLVSRPTTQLDGPLIASAAVESLAENLVDSWVAPLAAYSLFGMAGAYAYRAVNTADAMWGYHTPRYEYLGKSVARLDDLVNWVPARLSTLALWGMSGSRRQPALAVWRRDAARTASPNAGQPMACTAGALGIRLEKPGHYVLNASAAPPVAHDIRRARRLVAAAMWSSAAVAVAIRLVRHA
jgi:adenosylcobinamide-phosphate synthase